jgi:predicted Zn-dependent protease
VEAAALATRAVRLAPDVPHLHDTLAAIRVREREYDAAVASLSTASRLDPKTTKWRVRLAAVLVEAGRLTDARAQLDQIDSRHPGGADLPEPVREQLRSLREVLRAKT